MRQAVNSGPGHRAYQAIRSYIRLSRGAECTLVAMGTAQAAAPRPRLDSRPGRSVLVAADLAELQGPARGTVELPLRLFWSAPDRRFSLDDPDMLRSMYQKVLCEATRIDDLTGFLNGGKLVDVWPDLFLPAEVRRAWENRHAVLRARAAA
jgi:hypothetical protein